MKQDQIKTKGKPMPEWERQSRRQERIENIQMVVGALVLIAIVVAGLFLLRFIFQETTKPLPNWGTVTDKGSYLQGKNVRKYAYWVDVVADTGERMTWDVSDTFYQSVEIGDYVKRPGTKEEDSRVPDI